MRKFLLFLNYGGLCYSGLLTSSHCLISSETEPNSFQMPLTAYQDRLNMHKDFSLDYRQTLKEIEQGNTNKLGSVDRVALILFSQLKSMYRFRDGDSKPGDFWTKNNIQSCCMCAYGSHIINSYRAMHKLYYVRKVIIELQTAINCQLSFGTSNNPIFCMRGKDDKRISHLTKGGHSVPDSGLISLYEDEEYMCSRFKTVCLNKEFFAHSELVGAIENFKDYKLFTESSNCKLLKAISATRADLEYRIANEYKNLKYRVGHARTFLEQVKIG